MSLQIKPEDWAEVTKLLDAALELPVAAREQWVEELGERYESLKPQLRRLLSYSASIETNDFLNTLPKFAAAAEALEPDGAVQAGSLLGPYRLVRELGSGGMGLVWLAERADGLISRPVALKFPRGLWIREGLRERMAREREILASLEHPGIARLYDAGLTEAGDPYLALEYVEGRPLDLYCKDRQLGIDDRLDLFLQVIDAVAYAHSKLIVHRDLKPANILVTQNGQVRLLDFGIGKLLDEQQALRFRATELPEQALTPDYASPEQIAGLPLTVGTDVYSLGVILFELLTEQRPYRLKRNSRGALEDAILDEDPCRPSQLTNSDAWRRRLRGDLDAITLKALKKKAEERYTTAAGFAADVRRFLAHEPVEARPDTIQYRAQKFVRRHRAAVVASTAVCIALIAATGFTALQSIEAREQRDAAVYNQQQVQASHDFINLLLSEIGPGGQPLTMLELLDRGAAMLESQYGTEQRFLAPMWYELASSYFSLGRTERLIEMLDRAEHAARQHNDSNVLAATLCTLGRVKLRAEPDRSRGHIEEGSAVLDRIAVPSIDSIVSCARADALILELDGDRQAAIERLHGTLESLESNPIAAVQDRTQLMNELARLYYNARQLDRTLQVNKDTLSLMESAGLGQTRGYLIVSLNDATLLMSLGEIKRAFEAQMRLSERIRHLERAAQPVGFQAVYASSLRRLGRFEESLAISLEERKIAAASGNAYLKAEYDLQAALALVQLGRYDEAENAAQSATTELLKAPGTNQRVLEGIVIARASIALGRGHEEAARTLIQGGLHKLGYPQQRTAPPLLNLLRWATQIELEAGDAVAAEQYASDFYEIAAGIARAPDSSADLGQALLMRARARQQAGNTAGARSDLQQALPALRNGLGEDHADTREAQALLQAV